METYNVGFTSTRHGLSLRQAEVVRKMLKTLRRLHNRVVFHHGDCQGGDYQGHILARELGLYVVVHPPVDERLRGFVLGDEQRPALPYLKRNHVIVRESDLVLACPLGLEEIRSGTWSTVRYARHRHTPNVVVYQDGKTERRDYDPETRLFC